MRFRCLHCRTPEKKRVEFANDSGLCPQCGNRSVCPMVDIHFLVIGSGPLRGRHGTRQHIACAPARKWAALHPQLGGGSATADPVAVTCPLCHKTKAWQQRALTELNSKGRRRALKLVPFLAAAGA